MDATSPVSLTVPAPGALGEVFANEVALTSWLAGDAAFELLANLAEAGLVKSLTGQLRTEVRCPTGRADIVVDQPGSDGSGVACVVEAQRGTADADHVRRLLLDYTAHLEPATVALICERWSPALDPLLALASVPAAVFELQTYTTVGHGWALVLQQVRAHRPGVNPDEDAISALRAEVAGLRDWVDDVYRVACGHHIGGCEGPPAPGFACPCGASRADVKKRPPPGPA